MRQRIGERSGEVWPHSVLRWLIVAGGAVWALGCSPSSESTLPSTSTPAADTLRQVFQSYGQMTEYSDRATLRLSYRRGDQQVSEQTELQTTLARPGKLRFQLQRGDNTLAIVADGKQLWSSIQDAGSDNLRHQVVRRPVTGALSVSELYAATELLDPARPNQMMSLLLSLPLNLQVSQLGWLLGDQACASLVDTDQRIVELPAADWQQQPCRRIQIEATAGPYVFWIDPDTLRILRVEYPTQELFTQLPAADRPTQVQLDLQIHEFSAVEPNAFVAPTTPTATLVQYFVLPPLPLPHAKFGVQVPTFVLSTVDGRTEESGTWQGRPTVLVWFDQHPASKQTLLQLDDVAALFQDGDTVPNFRAIYVDPQASGAAERAAERVREWDVQLPLLVDAVAAGRDALQIDQAPTLAILDGQQRLQFFEVGANPQLSQTLPHVLRQLQAGRDLAQETRQMASADEQRFAQQLEVARADAPTSATGHGELAAASSFQTFTLTPAWEFHGLTAPGNVLVLPATKRRESQILVLDGMQNVVTLDLQGRELRRATLELDDSAFVAQLRHGVGGDGLDYFAGYSQLGRYVYVFDSSFQRLLRYPDERQQHRGILDVQLDDLDQDGQPELYLGLVDPHGIQQVDLTGKRRWSNRVVPSVLSIAAQRHTEPPHLLITGEQGRPVPISLQGEAGEPLAIGARTIHQLTAAPQAVPAAQFVGLSYTVEGRLIAVGFDRKLREVWSYGLPAGTYRSQLPPAQWMPFGGGTNGYWLLPGPDGSIHLVRDDGQLHDRCSLGKHLLGLTAHGTEGAGRLYLVTDQSLTAFDLSSTAGSN